MRCPYRIVEGPFQALAFRIHCLKRLNPSITFQCFLDFPSWPLSFELLLEYVSPTDHGSTCSWFAKTPLSNAFNIFSNVSHPKHNISFNLLSTNISWISIFNSQQFPSTCLSLKGLPMFDRLDQGPHWYLSIVLLASILILHANTFIKTMWQKIPRQTVFLFVWSLSGWWKV